MGLVVLLMGGLAACAAAPKYRSGSTQRPPRSSSPAPNTPAPQTPERLPRYTTLSGRVPDGPQRWGDHYLRGIASWYGQDFHGKKTASGEVYDMYKLTAAHRTLPLGTRARIWNIENGRNCVVVINDRGPFIEGRILDLSYAAALELLLAEKGLGHVQIEILKLPDKDGELLSDGAAGWECLKALIAHVPNEIPVILDAKRGDIGNSSQHYARLTS